ncbi:MAG: NAD synthetase [Candidatus Eisenbacteria bacterium]|nr:NAD synthetase [Candidatus Latescibacterota bacterium]MBD3301976.1 NAD synthetase [Candidatus Eisenbacteria bacterium]
MSLSAINLAYLAASLLFLFGLKGLTHPRTAVRGNLLGALGMLLAIVATLLDRRILSYQMILAGFVAGAAVGTILALRIQMTAMPQMVAVLNGFGGGASVLVAGAALVEAVHLPGSPGLQMRIATAASGLIGGLTFWGSLVAFGKLQGVVSERVLTFPGHRAVNLLLAAVAVALGILVVLDPGQVSSYWLLIAAASVIGVLLVLPVGGADMPVVVALLNSYSGLAAAATGFVLSNNVLIIAGSLVGASGLILTGIMCRAMNRSLSNVLFGGGGGGAGGGPADEVYGGKVRSTSADEVAMLLEGARRVVIVPGYGMAVAQAQHPIQDLASALGARDVEVEFGIHPVAGRMPGHMNVLLAEANVPYEQLRDMDEVNPTFQETDVVLVIGANDVVNPVARTDPSSPIAGMPILDVDKARSVVVIKRSLSPGFAGIPNPLFADERTLMLFGDGKKAVLDLVEALKES